MSWDYGVEDQIADEYSAAVANGYCYVCLIRKPDADGEPCYRCQEVH